MGAGSGAQLAVTPALAVLALCAALAVPRPRGPVPPEGPAPDTVSWAPSKPTDTLARGMALSHALDARGLDSDQVREITGRLRAYRDPRTLRPGTALRFATSPEGIPTHIQIELNPDSVLSLVRSGSVWTSRVELIPFVVDTVRVTGFIESNLWSARLGGDLDRFTTSEFEGMVYDLADVFAWNVDFNRDLRQGDAVRVVLERKIRPDGTIRSRHFLVVELRNRGHVYCAIPQERPGGRYAYYDEEGRSLRGAYLRYPVPYRITSNFARRRFHPVLKRYRAHTGIDYGAPAGTPVAATASGVVARAGWAGGYGRMVELRHPSGIRTRYAHLSAFGLGIHPGTRVEQGQIIGRVGSSGLATGPHLHYEFLVNGQHTNPLTVQVPNAASIATADMAEFKHDRDRALALLEGARFSDGTTIASRSSAPRNAALRP